MIYYKILENNNIISFGFCGKYMPADSIEISEAEYNKLVEEYETSPKEPNATIEDYESALNELGVNTDEEI